MRFLGPPKRRDLRKRLNDLLEVEQMDPKTAMDVAQGIHGLSISDWNLLMGTNSKVWKTEQQG